MNDSPWLMRIESGLSAHFNMPQGPSRPGTLWTVGLKRGAEIYTATVKALLADDATPATRKNSGYQAATAMQYLSDQLSAGWHPSQAREHTIHIGNPREPTSKAPRKPFWKLW
ncbi:MAG TPA: hypothetical protein VFB32_10070 [Rudaea sp.]|nr:hypothetical protein [Rudaea sp.]